MPEYFGIVSSSFKNMGGDWEHHFWQVSSSQFSEMEADDWVVIHTITRKDSVKSEKHYLRDIVAEEFVAVKLLASKQGYRVVIADIMRYALIESQGGFYFDMKMERLKSLQLILDEAGDATFIGANEDYYGAFIKEYLSNAFFAAIPGHPLLKRVRAAVNDRVTAVIDDPDIAMNQIVGPYFLATYGMPGFWDSSTVHLIEPRKIYPYISWGTPWDYDKAPELEGLDEERTGDDRCLHFPEHPGDTALNPDMKLTTDWNGYPVYYLYPCTYYPDAITVDHFDFGSSWAGTGKTDEDDDSDEDDESAIEAGSNNQSYDDTSL
ncbi:glycosyltransferase [Endozoicomonadaceae bacterium StTr2]